MLEKEEHSRTKNDMDDISAFFNLTDFAIHSGYDLGEFDKLNLIKTATYRHVPRGGKVYKRG